ncbi:hypothetical protein MTR67_003927 [Solanum verrucosum]|uniref:Uncharacterized protein n=1 Tax=Solanum verrucosum TaxID=315347 RepID=A0AAF0PTE8_SOLVR|nr:hypothetical protein MTR67_003927 [Solanum verrucosum]
MGASPRGPGGSVGRPRGAVPRCPGVGVGAAVPRGPGEGSLGVRRLKFLGGGASGHGASRSRDEGLGEWRLEVWESGSRGTAPRGPGMRGLLMVANAGDCRAVLCRDPTLGDWDMKLPRGSASPLIAEPEFRQIVLTEDDEFLISLNLRCLV